MSDGYLFYFIWKKRTKPLQRGTLKYTEEEDRGYTQDPQRHRLPFKEQTLSNSLSNLASLSSCCLTFGKEYFIHSSFP